MNRQDVIAFFDRLAPTWDDRPARNGAVIKTILDDAGITAGVSVLDVACGTGALFPDYLSRGVSRITGVDISPAMIARAREKFPDPRVRLLAADVEEFTFNERFQRCVLYNALPHFPDPARLIARLARMLAPGGRLTVAHGMSRESINARHAATAAAVSIPLLPADELAGILRAYLSVDVIVSDEARYVVSGVAANGTSAG